VPQHPGRDNVPFPNAHLRTNGFLVRRKDLLAMRPVSGILDKMDAYMLEHGRESMTRRFWAKGLKTLVVGRNGRGYEPAGWSASATFRNGGQRNLLVADNQTGAYDEAPPSEKSALYKLSWDNFAIPDEAVVALAAQRQDAPSVRLPAWSPTRRSEKWAFLRRLVGLPEAGISAKQARATGLFNAKWYLQRYPDVQAAGVDPLQHFLSHGQWELRSPGPGFDSEAYLNAHPAIKKTVLSPFEYFVKNEWSETAVD
jgi:hypothetical protein